MPSKSPDITYLARVAFRTDRRVFGVRRDDRRSHTYIIGKTGTGKSTLLRTMVLQDITRGEGLALFDPHGDLIRDIERQIPPARSADVVYLDVPDRDLRFHFNPVAGIARDHRALAVAGLVEVFKKLWPDDWGPRLEHVLRNVIWTLVEAPGTSLGDVPRLLADKEFRRQLVEEIENPEVRSFWEDEFAKYSPGFRSVVIAPLQNKMGALLTDPTLRRIFTGEENTLDLRTLMDSGKVLLVNLDKGRIGDGPAAVLGSFLVAHIALAGLARSDQPEGSRRDFTVYLDEFQQFATRSLATMLSELRKYRVGMVLSHQYLGQIEPEIRDAVFGNTGTQIAFRISAADAAFLAREFSPTFSTDDFIALPRFHIYLRLMINGQTSKPFSAMTLRSMDSVPGGMLDGSAHR
jgi:type IV secretory pathway TraG/TraD family ATPase VirD4